MTARTWRTAALAAVIGVALAITAALPATAATGADPAHRAGGSTPSVLSPTPYMGWNTYYGLGGSVTQDQVLAQARALKSTGLARAGYDIVWLDGGWQNSTPRGSDGQLQADRARFPDGMASLTAKLHAMGLKAGIYTDAGPYLPANCGLGSYGHYQTDADTFAAWGFDAVKVDFLCGIAANLDPKTVYMEFAKALRNNASHRPMILNICNPVTSPDWGDYPESQQSTNTWTYAPAIAQSWRTYTDVGFQGSIKFADVLRNFDANAAHPESAGPGHFSDPDYLGPQLGMTDEQFRTQVALWAISAAPLVIGNDLTKLTPTTLAALTNPRLVAVDQDRLGKQGTRVGPAGTTETWVKPLADGSRAVVLLNRGTTPATVQTTASALRLRGGLARVTDAWTGAVSQTRGTVRAAVPAQGTAVLVVSNAPGVAAPRVVLGAASTSSTLVAPGETVKLTATLTNDGVVPATGIQVSATAPSGWVVTDATKPPAILPPGRSATVVTTVTVPAAAAVGDATVAPTLRFRSPLGSGSSTGAPVMVTVAPPVPLAGASSLSAHPWVSATSGWMEPRVDQTVGGGPITMGGVVHPTGIGVASPSVVRYYLGGACTTLTGTVGIDDAVINVGPEGGTSTFSVVGDGASKYASPTITRGAATSFTADVTGVVDLQLVVGDAGDGGYNDRADWADLTVTCS
ncbi:NPCBM/NEW2 domain-containing protein [Pseudolysinimonas sp.]|uniref:NPCBM/NEW2 domain-containing protein n=1 Tax=Pseudolysinimonas sp. TaxID=2680009 RepID=UPI003F7F1538